MPQDFSLSYTNSLTPKRNSSKRSDLYRYLQKGMIQENPADSAQQLNLIGGYDDGYYWIKKNNGDPVNAYCIFSQNGGGWVRLNSSIATASNVSGNGVSWSGETLVVNFRSGGGGCGSFTNYNIQGTVPYTEMKVFIQRVSSIGQCQGFTYQTGNGWYDPPYNGTYTNDSMCTWTAGNFVQSGTSLTGTKLYWIKDLATTTNSFQTSFTTTCADETGTAYHTFWVR